MSTLFAIYQWVSALILVAGVAYAVNGALNRIPFVGRGKYSDSVLNRVAAGAAIAAVWPFFVLYFLIAKRGK